MRPRCNTLDPLRAKDSYNRISLQITWTNTGHDNKEIKFDRLRLDYQGSRMCIRDEKRRYLSEGLKTCK